MEASVVIPFYNAETTLTRAIDSVLAQQNVTLQIILVDNNSTDQSTVIATSYADRFDNISLHIESQQGANYARNLGLSVATKEWIQYLDADDELLPNKIYNQLSIDNIDSIDIVCSPITEHTNTGTIINYHVSDMSDIWLSLLQGKIGWTCSNLWKRSTLNELGGWNTNYSSHQEKELMARFIMKDKKFYFFDKSECIVYEQKESISKRTDFPLTGVKLMKFVSHYLTSNDMMNSPREKAIHNQFYHKLLMAYKINPEETKSVIKSTPLKLNYINLPLHHRLLINALGLEKGFEVLRLFIKI